jgi:hypothetical protein
MAVLMVAVSDLALAGTRATPQVRVIAGTVRVAHHLAVVVVHQEACWVVVKQQREAQQQRVGTKAVVAEHSVAVRQRPEVMQHKAETRTAVAVDHQAVILLR